MERAAEKRAADILLKRGVKVQVAAPLFFRIFGKKKLTYTIQAPSVEKLLKIASLYIDMHIENTGDMNLNEAFALLKNHGKKMSEIISLCISGFLPYKWRAKILRKLSEQEISTLFHLIIAYGGVEDFINTIRLTEATMITKPMSLSPQEKTS